MVGFIIGFDGEKKGVGDCIVNFVEEMIIFIVMFSMLQVLFNIVFWYCLKKEGCFLDKGVNINQVILINFIFIRLIEDIVREYVEVFWQLYDYEKFLDRIYWYFLIMGVFIIKSVVKMLSWIELWVLLIIFW